MDEYDQVEEFKARFEALKESTGDALGQTAMFVARLTDFGDDAECVYVSEKLAEINDVLAKVHTELHVLEQHLY